MKISNVLLLGYLLFLLSGCATMNEFWSRLSGKTEAEAGGADGASPGVRYSENPQMSVPTNREYKRMTRARMEDEAELGAQAGSMWVMEGQGAYLFAQNKSRREGDVLNVKLDGPSLKQVETKVNVIKKLLKQLEEAEPAVQTNKLAANGTEGAEAERNPASNATTKAVAKAVEPKDDGKDELLDIQQISTKIVEKLPDGNYRVRGAQPFMIGKREYKVIAAGMVRPEDFNDEGISSTKLIDPQFDVVSIRRKPTHE